MIRGPTANASARRSTRWIQASWREIRGRDHATRASWWRRGGAVVAPAKAGFDFHIVKPVDFAMLTKLLAGDLAVAAGRRPE